MKKFRIFVSVIRFFLNIFFKYFLMKVYKSSFFMAETWCTCTTVTNQYKFTQINCQQILFTHYSVLFHFLQWSILSISLVSTDVSYKDYAYSWLMSLEICFTISVVQRLSGNTHCSHCLQWFTKLLWSKFWQTSLFDL